MERHREQKEFADKKPYQAIVVMPYSSGPYRRGRKSKIDPEYSLSYESKMVTLAAAEAYQSGQADKIILLGEDTYESPEHNTTEFMKELLVAKGIPDSVIENYGSLNNTYVQIEKLAELTDADNIDDKFLVISLDFHAPRVGDTADKLDIPSDLNSAEDLLRKRSSHYEQVLDKWSESEQMRSTATKEKLLLRPLNRVDLNGYLQKYLTKKLGPRPPLTDQ